MFEWLWWKRNQKMISLKTFQAACPSNATPQEWIAALDAVLPKYDITTNRRIAMFLAQTSHESLDYTARRENLNYSAKGLLATWSTRFTVATANAYARKPELIANKVYGGRLGNSQTGDGWRFRGGGLIQLTGRSNYTAFGATLGMTAEEAVAYVETKRGAIESACWYWRTRELNRLSDLQDLWGVTRLINGGTNGVTDRTNRYNRIIATL